METLKQRYHGSLKEALVVVERLRVMERIRWAAIFQTEDDRGRISEEENKV
jgi:hypothetical protein